MLTEDREDYLADGLLHGLRQTPGVELVDHPRKHCSYIGGIASRDCPGLSVRGGGFNLYGTLPLDQEPDRNQIFRKLEMGWFDLVVVGNVWRQWGQLIDWRSLLATTPLALLDGDDDARLYPCSNTHLRSFGPWRPLADLLNRPQCLYFKREWHPAGVFEHARARWMGLRTQHIRPAGFSIPAEKLLDPGLLEVSRPRLFPTHIVDGELRELVGGKAEYSFSSEESYNWDLRSSRFGITTRRAGWDCLRHLELAANGCVICFRDLNAKPASAAPHGLNRRNAISYHTARELLERLENLPIAEEQKLRRAAWTWAHSHTTVRAAAALLGAFGWRPEAGS